MLKLLIFYVNFPSFKLVLSPHMSLLPNHFFTLSSGTKSLKPVTPIKITGA